MSKREELRGDIEMLRPELDSEAVTIGDAVLDSEVSEYISTQCPTLDVATGQGGIPVGRLTTIIGLEASGKSTVGLHLLAETQRRGGIAILADTERRYWKERATKLGVDQDLLIRLRGQTVEEIFKQITEVVTTVREKIPERLVTIVWDSIAGTPTQVDIDAEYGDDVIAPHARAITRAMRKLHPLAARERIALVFINQLREALSFSGFGRPQLRMIAEKPLTYWSSLKINLRRIERLGEKTKPTGIKVQADIVKTTIAPTEGHRAFFDLSYIHGIDFYGAALDAAVDGGFVESKAGWFVWKEQKFRRSGFGEIYQGDKELRHLIRKLPEAWKPDVHKELYGEEDAA